MFCDSGILEKASCQGVGKPYYTGCIYHEADREETLHEEITRKLREKRARGDDNG